jgi:hypothetical protein
MADAPLSSTLFKTDSSGKAVKWHAPEAAPCQPRRSHKSLCDLMRGVNADAVSPDRHQHITQHYLLT